MQLTLSDIFKSAVVDAIMFEVHAVRSKTDALTYISRDHKNYF